jgi:hypothetical protein
VSAVNLIQIQSTQVSDRLSKKNPTEIADASPERQSSSESRPAETEYQRMKKG